MKRILPLILALVAGMAQADSNTPAITRIRTRQNTTVA